MATVALDEGTPDEANQLNINAVREQLKAGLGSTKSAGTFMYQSTHESYPNPGIKIKDAGSIGLPLSPRDVEAVEQAS